MGHSTHELTEMYKKLAFSLVVVLPQCTGLVASREGFDAFYKRLEFRKVKDPENGIKNVCELIQKIQENQPPHLRSIKNWIHCIVEKLQGRLEYSPVLQQSLEELCKPDIIRGVPPLTAAEKQFIVFLISLHLQNTIAKVYKAELW